MKTLELFFKTILISRCEELVAIFHSVKFAKCEICSSTKRSMATILFSGHMADPVNADPILMLFCADIKQLFFHSNMMADQAPRL